MVLNYKKKSNRQEWLEENMEAAVWSVLESNMSCRKAAEKHGVPRSTLGRKIKKCLGNKENITAACKKDKC